MRKKEKEKSKNTRSLFLRNRELSGPVVLADFESSGWTGCVGPIWPNVLLLNGLVNTEVWWNSIIIFKLKFTVHNFVSQRTCEIAEQINPSPCSFNYTQIQQHILFVYFRIIHRFYR